MSIPPRITVSSVVQSSWIFLAWALASCSIFEKPVEEPKAPVAVLPSVTSVPAVRSSADELVAYAASIRSFSENALAAEASKRKREAGDVSRVKAAIALSISAQADEGEILALVEPLEKRATDRDVKAMAGFLQAMALERRRLKENAAARLRDEHRASDAQRQRADALQQKLDALSELEKSLSDRKTSP
jgi:hypothetical protein